MSQNMPAQTSEQDNAIFQAWLDSSALARKGYYHHAESTIDSVIFRIETDDQAEVTGFFADLAREPNRPIIKPRVNTIISPDAGDWLFLRGWFEDDPANRYTLAFPLLQFADYLTVVAATGRFCVTFGDPLDGAIIFDLGIQTDTLRDHLQRYKSEFQGTDTP